MKKILSSIQHLHIGKLPIAVLNMQETAQLMVDFAGESHRKKTLFMTSANGEVMARCHDTPSLAPVFLGFDVISADGQPMVTASKWLTTLPLPERVATTDLFNVVAAMAEEKGLSFYMLGADCSENAKAVKEVIKKYPRLKIVGAHHGFMDDAEMSEKVNEINNLAPDILWVALGVPKEQFFVQKYGKLLDNVGVIKTAGGLFNFLSKSRSRAPEWMQKRSLEWLWRLMLEPRRLFWRYCVTNPKALYILLTQMHG